MAETNISKAEVTDMSNVVDDFEVGALNIEGVSDNKETEYSNPDFSKWLGYYKKIPELKSAIDAKATWTVGKGFTADTRTTVILDNINGVGNETFDGIMKNMIVVGQINGDAYSEVIKNDEGTLINLKPLDPTGMTVVFNTHGLIIRYEQRTKVGTVKIKKEFKPHEIFHLTKDRMANEMHGTSIIEAVEWVILARNEVMEDQKKLMHRNVVPRIIWHLDEDNPEKIKAFKDKQDRIVNTSENIVVPKGTVEHEVLSVAPNATLNPLPWIEYLSGFFFQAVRMPQIIVGGSQEFTEATAKIAYLAFEQTVKEEQRDIMEQVWDQLALRIELKFPASLQNELLSDTGKDEENGAIKPAEQEATLTQD